MSLLFAGIRLICLSRQWPGWVPLRFGIGGIEDKPLEFSCIYNIHDGVNYFLWML